MKTLHLRVEDDFLEELKSMLPKEKVIIVDQKFLNDQSLLEEALQSYLLGDEAFITYYKEMDKMDEWLKGKESR